MTNKYAQLHWESGKYKLKCGIIFYPLTDNAYFGDLAESIIDI